MTVAVREMPRRHRIGTVVGVTTRLHTIRVGSRGGPETDHGIYRKLGEVSLAPRALDHTQWFSERVWREQLQRKVSCSLTMVGDKLYTFSEEGQGFVHEVSRKGAKELAVNEFKEPIFASPIVFENTLIVRSEKALWRFGKGK